MIYEITPHEDEDEEPPLARRSASHSRRKGSPPAAVQVLLALCFLPRVSAEPEKGSTAFAVEAAMIPILVLLSGAVAGLTLGYMSLDMTTLQVLMKTGTEKQRKQAAAIIPIRKDGHLLLISLIIANMLINEILPLLAENVFGGGIQAVVASTALIVIFAEIIPQSVCTRFGLQIGARMVLPVRALIILFYVVAKPASMLLTRLLGSHSGMIYRRAELKELVALHQLDETGSHRGGDLQPDTVQIVGTALDFQEKSVADAMTPIANVFMLDLNTTKLDYEVLGRVLQSGHSRIPVYEEIQAEPGSERLSKKIVGVILTKQFILLDPEDAVPLKDLPIHPVPIVCENVPLHTILNTFQEGRSHIAVVAPLLPQYREELEKANASDSSPPSSPGKERSLLRTLFRHESRDEKDALKRAEAGEGHGPLEMKDLAEVKGSQINLMAAMSDVDHPVGIITLEDVLEELIGEEILDEFDVGPGGSASLRPYMPSDYHTRVNTKTPKVMRPPYLHAMTAGAKSEKISSAPPTPVAASTAEGHDTPPVSMPKQLLKAGSFLLPARSKSQPARSRVEVFEKPVSEKSEQTSDLGPVLEKHHSTAATEGTVVDEPEEMSSADTAARRRSMGDPAQLEQDSNNPQPTSAGRKASLHIPLPQAQLERGRRAAWRLQGASGTSTPTSLVPPSLAALAPQTSSLPPAPRKQMFKTAGSPPSHPNVRKGSQGGTATPIAVEPTEAADEVNGLAGNDDAHGT